MADVLIRGMEMPKSCDVCPFVGTNDDLMSDDYRYLYCGFPYMGQFVTDYEATRHADCPLLPLPEGHGRLGDLDKLAASFRESAEECKRLADAVKGDPLKEVNNKAIYAAIIEAILRTKAAPTIVPAEGGADTDG